MLQISPTVYINPFMLDAVLSKQGEDTLYTSTEGILHREGPTTTQLAANGFLQFGDLWINKLRIARIITATDTVYTSSGYLFKCPGANWSAVASQLSYKETTVYGYEVPGLRYVVSNSLPSNISGLPPELTGGTGEGGGFEMQFLGYYPTDLPIVTTNSWDVVDTTVEPITIGTDNFYHTLSYTTGVSGGTLTMTQPAGSTTHYSIVVVHTPDASPQQILNDVLTGEVTCEQSIHIVDYNTSAVVRKRHGTTIIGSVVVVPHFTTFSLVDGVVLLDGTPLPMQLSASELSVTVVYIALTSTSLPFSFSASGVEKLGAPYTNGYYLSASDTSAYGRQILAGEAILFTDAPDAIVIQDYTARAATVTPLISQFISSGSNFIAAVQDIPTTPGWYLSADGHSDLPAGRVFRVNPDSSYEHSDAPLGLRATIVNGYMTHYLVADYSGNSDGLVPNLPGNWSAYNTNTIPASYDMDTGTIRQVLVDRGSIHYFTNVGNTLSLTFSSDGSVISGTAAYSGSIIVQGSDLISCVIDFPGLAVQPEVRAISCLANYIIFDYIGLGGNFYITNVKPVITNSMAVSFSKGNAGPVSGDWLEISNLDIDFVSLFNDNGDTGTLTLDFKHPLEHNPRIVTFYIADDMLGDVVIAVTGQSVTFTSPTAGQYLQVYIGGPVGLAKL